MWLGLALLCGAGGLGLTYMLWRLGRMIRSVDKMVADVTTEVVPVISKVGTSVESFNVQLQKVDMMVDSAVDIAESADTAVRAVSMAIAEPVKYVASTLSGITAAVESFSDRVSEEDEADGTHTASW